MQPVPGRSKDALVPDKGRIRFLDSLRGAAIFMVVAWHAQGYCPSLHGLQGRVIYFFLSIWIPTFFLIDGYLFADGVLSGRACGYRAYVRRSAIRLLFPWLFFTVFYALARYPLEQAGFLSDRLIMGRSPLTVILFGWGSVYAGQLYFLVSLFLIRLAAPVTERLCRTSRLRAVLCCLAFYLVFRLAIGPLEGALRIPGGQEPLLHAVWGAQFYLSGVLLRLFHTVVARAAGAVALGSLTILIALASASPARLAPGRPLTQYACFLGVFAFFLWACRGRTGESRIGRSTMGIYLLHAPLLLKAGSMAGAALAMPPLATYLAVTGSVFLAAYGLTEVLTRLPHASRLFGPASGSGTVGAGKRRLTAA